MVATTAIASGIRRLGLARVSREAPRIIATKSGGIRPAV